MDIYEITQYRLAKLNQLIEMIFEPVHACSRSYNLIYVYNILVVPKSKSHRRRTTVYPRATYTYIVSSPVSTSHCVMYRSSPAAARSTTHVVTRV